MLDLILMSHSSICDGFSLATIDLRGSGMLGLLQLLYMVSDPRLIPLTRDIYRLSRHDEQVCLVLYLTMFAINSIINNLVLYLTMFTINSIKNNVVCAGHFVQRNCTIAKT